MANLRIAPVNFHDDSSLSSSSELGDLFVTNTQSVARGLIWRGDAASIPVTHSGSFTADRVANCFSLFRHNLIGRKVRLELFSSASYTGSVYDSGATNVLGPTLTSGYDWGYQPDVTNSQYDPLHSEGPYTDYFSSVTFRSYKITFTNNTSAAATLEVCRAFLGQYVEFELNPEPGTSLALGWDTNSTQARTWGGSLRTNNKSRWRSLTFNMGMVFESQRPILLDMMAVCGLTRDVFVSLHPGDGTRLERDHSMNAKFANMDAITREYSFSTKKISFLEV